MNMYFSSLKKNVKKYFSFSLQRLFYYGLSHIIVRSVVAYSSRLRGENIKHDWKHYGVNVGSNPAQITLFNYSTVVVETS